MGMGMARAVGIGSELLSAHRARQVAVRPGPGRFQCRSSGAAVATKRPLLPLRGAASASMCRGAEDADSFIGRSALTRQSRETGLPNVQASSAGVPLTPPIAQHSSAALPTKSHVLCSSLLSDPMPMLVPGLLEVQEKKLNYPHQSQL